MAWRLAKSLETLRSQVNKAYPKRSKASDGTIGDAAHSARTSDHNPNAKGVVCALDLTHDPKNGLDIQMLADALVTSKDARIKYIICNGRIVSGAGEKQTAWKWRPYSGKNAHSKHVHVSVKGDYDDTREWKLPTGKPATVAPKDAVLKLGSKGQYVRELQINLHALGYDIEVDGDFGNGTEKAVKAFQKANGLEDDGWAGPRTLEAIGRAIGAKEAKPKLDAAEKMPGKVETVVKKRTNWLWQGIAGLFGTGTVGTWLADAEPQTVAIVAGVGVVIVVLVLATGVFIVRRVKAIKAELNA